MTTEQGARGEATADTAIVRTPHLEISKSVYDTTRPETKTLSYSVAVICYGNVTLTGVNVTDALSPDLVYASGDNNLNGALDVGETWVYQGTQDRKSVV